MQGSRHWVRLWCCGDFCSLLGKLYWFLPAFRKAALIFTAFRKALLIYARSHRIRSANKLCLPILHNGKAEIYSNSGFSPTQSGSEVGILWGRSQSSNTTVCLFTLSGCHHKLPKAKNPQYKRNAKQSENPWRVRIDSVLYYRSFFCFCQERYKNLFS